MPARRSMDFYFSMAAAIVWNERRTHETHMEAATRCAAEMALRGLEDVDPHKVLEWAVQVRADRIAEAELRAEANRRLDGPPGHLPDPAPERVNELRAACWAEIERTLDAVVESRGRS